MKAANFAFLRCVTASWPSAVLIVIILIAATTTTAAQTNVFVPGNASGGFGNGDPVDEYIQLIPALTVSGPGTITVTYVSGLVVWDGAGDATGPDGTTCDWCVGQTPLNEAQGIGLMEVEKIAALIGVFVPQNRAQHAGFKALDGTKNVTPVGILPNGLFFIGTGRTGSVSEAGTLYLGINDWHVSDNSGGFNVTVTGP